MCLAKFTDWRHLEGSSLSALHFLFLPAWLAGNLWETIMPRKPDQELVGCWLLSAGIMTQIAINQLPAINLCHWAKGKRNPNVNAVLAISIMQVTVADPYRKCEKRKSQHLANRAGPGCSPSNESILSVIAFAPRHR